MKSKDVAIINDQIREKIVSVRGQNVLIDSDVAALYGVTTKEVNQAVRNNQDKFLPGYVIPLDNRTKEEVVKNFDHLQSLRFSHVLPKAFTEKGLYMLATILKSPQAILRQKMQSIFCHSHVGGNRVYKPRAKRANINGSRREPSSRRRAGSTAAQQFIDCLRRNGYRPSPV